MSGFYDCRQLEVWKKSMEFCMSVYALVKNFPPEEKYALGDQLRRAVVSIPSNIAEGNGRGSRAEYAHFLGISRGSLFEVRTQLELAEQLGYCKPSAETWSQNEEISKSSMR